jgi:hypothetical protein
MWAAPGFADVDIDTASHAVKRHGLDDVDLIHRCLDEKGPTKTFYNQDTERWAQVCQLDDTGKSWGIQIVQEYKKKFNEITAFPGRDMWLDEVTAYLRGRGYVHIP